MNNLKAVKSSILQGDKWRITLLTECLVRFEYSEEGRFTDEETQTVTNRRFAPVSFRTRDTGTELEIFTKYLEIHYDRTPFWQGGLWVRYHVGGCSSTWNYGDKLYDLLGTARTLDGADGAVELGHGVLSRGGWSVLDDSRSAIVRQDGSISASPDGRTDFYFFCYGHEYQKCLQAFYTLTGRTPMIPRFALGNWWSRYHAYTQEEYETLIERFEQEEVPLSVAVIDMDWHLVKIDPHYGDGWTGYTWNEALFPDHKAFLKFLHRHGLKTALNVHPADGVRAYEKPYAAMAKALGRDAANEEPIPFDYTDPAYRKAEFDYIFHPYEKEGVDFWWIDWQQGSASRLPGVDPLWLINRYHYEDNSRGGRAGLTFSRYFGPGSHRYPIGFSGDTQMTWASLRFQPYFTANASNIGFGWWSHDIGGHYLGVRDEELYQRWIQLGVFSPILRIHSSNNPYLHKEPWLMHEDVRQNADAFLRLRHALIPYLYTMNVAACRQGRPLVRPMYYEDPEVHDTYAVPNEYYFGTELVCVPITTKADETGFACEKAYLPEGVFYDFFNGMKYHGGCMKELCRVPEEMPVLSRAGGIVPMADLEDFYTASTENPSHMEVRVFAGADGHFTMEETKEGQDSDPDKTAKTEMAWDEASHTFSVKAVSGVKEAVPATRTWKIVIYGVPCEAKASGAGILSQSYEASRGALVVRLKEKPVSRSFRVVVDTKGKEPQDRTQEMVRKVLSQARIGNEVKWDYTRYMEAGHTHEQLLSQLLCDPEFPETIKKAVTEILLA